MWTLCMDESGRFDGKAVPGESRERVALVVGGVVCPGSATDLDIEWQAALKRGCKDLGVAYPPHATENPDKASDLRRLAADQVKARGGAWIFVISEPPKKSSLQKDLVRFARMLGEIVDIAARYVASQGGRQLHVRPAQRTVPATNKALEQAKKLGLGTVLLDDDEMLRTQADTEVRQALDALGREDQGALHPFPDLASIEVITASSYSAHCGVFLADIGCNTVYRHLAPPAQEIPSDLDEALGPAPVLVLGLGGLRRLREVDRCLREQPADLVRAAGAVAFLDGHARGHSAQLCRFRAGRLGLARMAAMFWDEACRILSRQQRANPLEIAKLLAGAADVQLSFKTGAYQGTMRALEGAWASKGPLAAHLRKSVEDRELRGRLWRVVMECANHCGDVEGAQRALAEFDAIVRGGRSLTLVAEELEVRNLAVVMAQNRLPTEDDVLDDTLTELLEATEALLQRSSDAAELVVLARPTEPEAQPALCSQAKSQQERALWLAATGDAPAFDAPDRELGRCYGTAARTAGFLQDVDRALELAMKARSYFGASPFDLTFNASVIGRVEMERARLEGAQRSQKGRAVLRAAMELAGASAIAKPKRVRARLQDSKVAVRFPLDLLLSGLLWSPDELMAKRDQWLDALQQAGDGSLYSALSAGELRSHPTEIVARHAGELVRAAGDPGAARRWFELSIEVAQQTDANSTLRRFAPFTRHLANGGGATGRPNSVLCPVFEYR